MTDPLEEQKEALKAVSEALTKLVALSKRETDECFLCGRKVERMSKVGRCVYARPCGCRLWQGTVPDAWKPSKSQKE